MLFQSRLTAPMCSVLLLVAVFIQTRHGSHAWNSGTPAARQSKQPSGKHLPGNLEHLLMSYRHQTTEDPIVNHRSNRHAADYGNLTELWDFIQTDKPNEHLASRTSNSLTPEYNDQMAPLRTIRAAQGVRSGETAPTVRRRKRQFEKSTQHVDEATFKSYEECISNRSSSYVGKQRRLRPEPVLFQEGQSVSLKCILWWVLMTGWSNFKTTIYINTVLWL